MRTQEQLFNKATISQESMSECGNAYLLSQTDLITPDSNVFSLPILKSVKPKDDTDMPTEQDAANNTYPLAGGKRTSSVETEFLQQDAATMNFPNTFRGEAMFLCIEGRRYPVAGKKQLILAPCAKVESKLEGGSNTSKQNFIVLPSVALQTVNLVSLTAGFHNTFTCTAYPVPANSTIIYYEE